MRWTHCALLAAVGMLPAASHGQQLPDPAEEAHRPTRITINPFENDKPGVIVLRERTGEEASTREKGSYLGVSASPPPHVLRRQLGLAPGIGLVVDFVVPDSPASRAGLQQYDVLQKLEDQFIVNQQQLAVLVRAHKPGDEIKLAVFRDGKLTVLTAKLAEHDLEPLPEEAESGDDLSHLRRMIPEPGIRPIVPGERPMPGWGGPWGWGQSKGPSSMTWLDDDKSYTLSTDHEGHKTFTVKDKEGKVLEQAAVDTKEEREKLTPSLREKLSRMQERFPGSPVKAPPSEKDQKPAYEPGKESDKVHPEK